MIFEKDINEEEYVRVFGYHFVGCANIRKNVIICLCVFQ